MGKEVVLASTNVVQQASNIARLVQAIHTEGIGLPAEAFPVKHHFAPMQYAREMLIPKDTLVVGMVHKQSHVNIVSAGTCTVYSTGVGEEYIQAPCTFVSHAGVQRVIVAHEDTVWTTVHVTDKTDPDDILRDITEEN